MKTYLIITLFFIFSNHAFAKENTTTEENGIVTINEYYSNDFKKIILIDTITGIKQTKEYIGNKRYNRREIIYYNDYILRALNNLGQDNKTDFIATDILKTNDTILNYIEKNILSSYNIKIIDIFKLSQSDRKEIKNSLNTLFSNSSIINNSTVKTLCVIQHKKKKHEKYSFELAYDFKNNYLHGFSGGGENVSEEVAKKLIQDICILK